MKLLRSFDWAWTLAFIVATIEVVFTFVGILAVTTIFFILASWSFIPLLGFAKAIFPS